ncbi:N(6)-L-threonylcarbamoyladenine synthase [Malassezia vespertilionis]|uniref:N(6)-L-threonylcarbamoyladenine synthase n=1 Tax=Malassezia vespertilionis TaxID=2020962 RepID=UPI0024B14C21|nr:N(6)-L-threonylcarbamoyladenine synthase [Malassezia vespertilionis]WFD08510.1 N(6)-L-threonylcarbamoyladenine synthase [Malassezia vespertilionis]
MLTESATPHFPFLTLLVSGGHTMLVLVQSLDKFQILADTLDDSVGFVATSTDRRNTFDKFARTLALGWQSAPGALVEQLAAQHTDGNAVTLPRILLGAPSFSYSGLKSAASRAVQRAGGPESMSTQDKAALAHAFQHAAFAQLEDKMVRALVCKKPPMRIPKGWHLHETSNIPPEAIQSVVCSGGVASNMELRRRCAPVFPSVRDPIC